MWAQYVKATVTLTDVDGDEHDYEVGADVSYQPADRSCGFMSPAYEVGEPDVSAPGCKVELSRIVDTDLLAPGWSELVEEALAEVYAETLDEGPDEADYCYGED